EVRETTPRMVARVTPEAGDRRRLEIDCTEASGGAGRKARCEGREPAPKKMDVDRGVTLLEARASESMVCRSASVAGRATTLRHSPPEEYERKPITPDFRQVLSTTATAVVVLVSG